MSTTTERPLKARCRMELNPSLMLRVGVVCIDKVQCTREHGHSGTHTAITGRWGSSYGSPSHWGDAYAIDPADNDTQIVEDLTC